MACFKEGVTDFRRERRLVTKREAELAIFQRKIDAYKAEYVLCKDRQTVAEREDARWACRTLVQASHFRVANSSHPCLCLCLSMCVYAAWMPARPCSLPRWACWRRGWPSSHRP